MSKGYRLQATGDRQSCLCPTLSFDGRETDLLAVACCLLPVAFESLSRGVFG